MDKSTYLKIIERTEKQFKFAIAIRAACNSIEENYAEYFEAFSYGPHLCKYEDLYLEPEDEKVACATLEHSTTYIIATQLDSFLEKFVKNRFNHRNDGIRNASLILRQIRNAFAHDPLNPTWDIRQPEAMNKILVVKDIIKLDTKEINGKRIQRLHYGGPLAILKLSEFIRMKLS